VYCTHQSPLQIVQQQNLFLSNQLKENKILVSPKTHSISLPSPIPLKQKSRKKNRIEKHELKIRKKDIPSYQPEILNVLNQDAASFANLCI